MPDKFFCRTLCFFLQKLKPLKLLRVISTLCTNKMLNLNDISLIMYQSIPNLTIPPPPQAINPRKISLNGQPPLGHQASVKPQHLGQKIPLKSHPQEIIFKNSAKTTKHETEIMNSSGTEMLNMLRILKQY